MQLDELVDEGVEHLPNAKPILNDMLLYTPPPLLDVRIPNVRTLSSSVPQAALTWAASQTLAFHRMSADFDALRSGGAAVAFTLADGVEDSLWAVASTFGHSEMFVQLAPGDPPSQVFPPIMRQSLAVFADYHERCIAGG